MKLSKSFLASLKERLFLILKEKVTKAILKKLVISGGLKGWLVSFVIEEILEEVDEHLIEPAFRKIGYGIDVHKGKKIYKRIENAEDRDDWRDVVNDV